MKFLIDAQLPRRIAYDLRAAGHETLHTLDLPQGNRTTDAELIAIAARDERIIVSKDADFVNSFVLMRQPSRLLLISTGNIRNADLEALLLAKLPAIEAAFNGANFVELTRHAIIIRG